MPNREISYSDFLHYMCRAGNGGNDSVITILHFNDVYNIEDHGEKGGASRMKTVMKKYAHLNPLVIFSGDAFSPSMSMYRKVRKFVLINSATVCQQIIILR